MPQSARRNCSKRSPLSRKQVTEFHTYIMSTRPTRWTFFIPTPSSPPNCPFRGQPPSETQSSPPNRPFRGQPPPETQSSPPNRPFRGQPYESVPRGGEQFIQYRQIKFQNSTERIIGRIIFFMQFTGKLNLLIRRQHTQFTRETLFRTV